MRRQCFHAVHIDDAVSLRLDPPYDFVAAVALFRFSIMFNIDSKRWRDSFTHQVRLFKIAIHDQRADILDLKVTAVEIV